MDTAMNDHRYLIWSNRDLDLEDWRADLLDSQPSLTEEQLYEEMYRCNDEYLEDERISLDIVMDGPILVIADLGLWNGRFPGTAMIPSGNIKDCLYSNTDYTEWYVDKDGDLRSDGVHHDGVNHYLYRAVRADASEEDIDALRDGIHTGKATSQDISKVTERLGDAIGKVYGWSFAPEKLSLEETIRSAEDRSDSVSKRGVTEPER